MTKHIELVPISEGNRITVKIDEKISIGRGSSLGCNDKKISRHHAELVFKKDETLWIKPTHTNPVFYRSSTGKTIQLTKDIEQELKHGDQIGLLPTTYFFRICASNESNDVSKSSKQEEKPVDKNGIADTDTATISSKNSSDKTKSSDVEPKPVAKDNGASSRNDYDDSNKTPRRLPDWMHTSKTTSSSTDHSSKKRSLNSDEDKNTKTDQTVKTSDESKKDSNEPVSAKGFDDDSSDHVDSTSSKKSKSSHKPRPTCPYGKSCYRKNLQHRADQSHPGDSDYEEEKQKNDDKKDGDDDDSDKPLCQYGKSCYRQNPQHRLDFKH